MIRRFVGFWTLFLRTRSFRKVRKAQFLGKNTAKLALPPPRVNRKRFRGRKWRKPFRGICVTSSTATSVVCFWLLPNRLTAGGVVPCGWSNSSFLFPQSALGSRLRGFNLGADCFYAGRGGKSLPLPRQLETAPGGSGFLLPASRHEIALEPRTASGRPRTGG
jgi:hypothetical protein